MIAVHWINRADLLTASWHSGGWRLRRAAGRALLADTAAALGLGAVRVLRSPGQRPAFDPPTHYFTMSHSGDLTVCAVSNNNIGIDLEVLGTARAQRLAESPSMRFFTENERSEGTADPEGLIRIFTLKEAWSKYVGVGLGIGLGSFDERSVKARHQCLTFSRLRIAGAACTLCHNANDTVVVRARALSVSQLNAAEQADRRERTT